MTKRKFKPKYKLGDVVEFTHTISFAYDSENRRIHSRTSHKGTGVIVGCKNAPIGKYYKGSYSLNPEDYNPPELHVEYTIPVYFIRQRLFGKQLQVLPEDIVT